MPTLPEKLWWRPFIRKIVLHPRTSSLALFFLLGSTSIWHTCYRHSLPEPASLTQLDTVLLQQPRVIADARGDRTVELAFRATQGFRLGYIRHINFIWSADSLPPELKHLGKGSRVTLAVQPHAGQQTTARIWALRTPYFDILSPEQSLQGYRHARLLFSVLLLLLAGLGGLGGFIVLQHLKPLPGSATA